MHSKELNEKNPLTIYVKGLMKENAGTQFNVWNYLNDQTGLNVQNLILICKKDRKQAMNTSIKTYKLLLDKLGVDLLTKNY